MSAEQIKDFPKLTLEQIEKEITYGKYQIKQAISYIAEHLSDTGKYEMRTLITFTIF